MTNQKPTKKELDQLAEQIKKDQSSAKPAEKRVKINTNFKKAIKKMSRTPSPKRER